MFRATGAERQRMVIMPILPGGAVEPPLAYLSIKLPTKGKTAPPQAEPLFNHRAVLGSLMGLGLKRGKIGDIF